MKTIIGRKIGMTSVFAEDGTQYPVSVIEVLPNTVIQKKTVDKDGYEAVVVGYEPKKKNITKAMKGVFDKAHSETKADVFELKGDEVYKYEVGQDILCSIFEAGDNVDVTGTSKGRGYSGIIKRYHATIGPKGHGSGYHRQIGSLATNGRTNNRVHPGKTMSGHHGHYTRTTLNLTVVAVYPDKNAILIKGSVPGPNKSIIKIRTATRDPNLKHAVKPLINRTVAKAAAPVAEAAPAAEAK
ncbi:MAG: 50S ribosomal protein L3 [Bacilli bacterium]|jgi:large subunit ribosomal protein L3|nr:50S ribosomal protein L3 [Bacilli bacterium]